MTTILLVEDNPISRKMMRFALEAKGYRVLAAPDSASAERLAAKERPDLCLVDLVLPDGSGFDLVPRLRAQRGGDRIPILACSGFVSKFEEARMSAAGFDDVVAKPVEPSRLLQVIRAHLPEDERRVDDFGRGRRLVVADDDAMQLKLVTMRLARHGFETVTARDGQEALELARRAPPDAIVTDVLMPRLDGFELCREVRRDPALEQVPVVLVTNSYIEPRDRDLARAIGAADLVLRTPELREVADVLRGALTSDVPPSTTDPASLDALDAERTRRAMHQLERQLAINARLSRRYASLAAELSVLSGISAALTEGHDPEGALDAVLAACLDAGGISQGGLFLLNEDGELETRAFIGDDDSALSPKQLVRDPDTRARLLAEAKTTVYSRSDGHTALAAIGMGSALLVPLHRSGAPLGALVFAASGDELLQDERIAFAEAVANQIALAVTLARTFSELSASEQRARAGEAKLHSILETIPDAVLVADLAGKIVQWNRAGEPLARARASADSHAQWIERVGLFLADQRTLCPADQLPLERALGGDTVSRAELFLRAPGHADGGVWLSVNALPLCHDSTPSGAVAVYRDVTPERTAQAQLMASDRLTSMGMLAAGLAHELNNPLASVSGNLDLACEALAQSDHDHARAALADAREAASRMRDIVDDVRIFSRIEDQVLERVDVTRVLDSSLRLAHGELSRRARIVREYESAPAVLGVESRLGQAFLNLVMNAAQAIAPGRVADNHVRVAVRSDGGRVLVTISDTGSGMSPEVLARLFTPFFTTKPPRIGTGLGLVITQRIIQSFEGAIAVESMPGRGTTFRITLPEASQRLKTIPPETLHTGAAPRRGCILVIDDDPSIGKLVQRALAAAHEVHVETSAPAALARIHGGERFDVILCDMTMPVMTGMELYRALEEGAPEQARRVVFFTGGTLTGDSRAFLQGVANRKLPKPFKLDELRRLIEQQLD